MNHRAITSMLSLVALLHLTSVAHASDADLSGDGKYLDGEALKKSLTAGIQSLYESKRAPEMKTLLKNIGSHHCTLEITAPGQSSLTPVQIYERFQKSVVMIGSIYHCTKCKNWHLNNASGFFLTRTGILVTNYHVVNQKDHTAMGVITRDGNVYAVTKILAADQPSDVAILQVDGTGFEPIALATQTPVGASVNLISNPGNHPFSFAHGIVSGYFLTREDSTKSAVRRMTITADYGGGSSGGPVIDEHGGVAGMVASTTPVMGGCDHNQYAQMIFKDCVPAESIRALISNK